MGVLKESRKGKLFPKNEATQASELLGIVDSDVCGPMETTSLG